VAAPTFAEAEQHYAALPQRGAVVTSSLPDPVELFVHQQALPPLPANAVDFIVAASAEQRLGDSKAAATSMDQAINMLQRWQRLLSASALLLLCLGLTGCVFDGVTGLGVQRDPATNAWTVSGTYTPPASKPLATK
jgi:hypothetical protein